METYAPGAYVRLNRTFLSRYDLYLFCAKFMGLSASRVSNAVQLIIFILIAGSESMLSTSGGIFIVVGDAGSGGCRLSTRLNGVRFVDRCIWTLNAFVSTVAHLFQSCW